MPKDEVFSKVATTIEAGLPDPFLMDFQLARRIVTNHIITEAANGIQKLDQVLHPGGLVNTGFSVGYDNLSFTMSSTSFSMILAQSVTKNFF